MPYILLLLTTPFLSFFWNNVKICDFFMNHDKEGDQKTAWLASKIDFRKKFKKWMG